MFSLLIVAIAACGVNAHIAMWNKGLFGLNWPHQANDSKHNYNNNLPVVPLRKFENLPMSKWFGHGLKNYPPAPGSFMELEAGGTFVGELSCNRAWTSQRQPWLGGPLPYYACPDVKPLHVFNKFGEEPDPQHFGGTAIAIAYTSDVEALMPDDMIVISVNYTSVWTRETNYPIPCGLPPCPPGGCLCTWNWIHQSWHGEGYGEEIYNNLYRCNVSGETNPGNKLEMKSGVPPMFCEQDPDMCVFGPKQPMVGHKTDRLVTAVHLAGGSSCFTDQRGNNMPWPGHWPHYNHKFGYRDGAQLDIFGDLLKTQCPQKKEPTEPTLEHTTVPVTEDEAPAVSDNVDSERKAQAPMSAGSTIGEVSGEMADLGLYDAVSYVRKEQHALQVYTTNTDDVPPSLQATPEGTDQSRLSQWVMLISS